MATSSLPEITYLPAFLVDCQELFAQLCHETVWDERMYSRRTASFGVAYNYSGIFYPNVTMPPAIAVLAARVAAQVSHPIDNCLANLYADGSQTMGFHNSDATAELVAGSTVSVLSLGAARTLTFRRKAQR